MIKRGLREPMLTVIDGCPGLIKAVEELFPNSDIQRCTKHRTENVLSKGLKEDREAVKNSLRKIFYASTYEHALEAIEIFKSNWGKKYPSAVDRVMSDILQIPLQALEANKMSFREVRRRVRGIER